MVYKIMSKKIDLTGVRFGRWTVISETFLRDVDGSKFWVCSCDCGVLRIVNSNSLRRGLSTSCGCLTRERTAETSFKDLIGKSFGYLVPYKALDQRSPSGNVMWECVCRCGSVVSVSSSSLLNGTTKSCGCYNREQIVKANTKHGLSKTKSWRSYINRIRLEKKTKLDTNWTAEMEVAIRQLMPCCIICGITEEEHLNKYKQRLHIDHVLPMSKGNGLKPGNAVVLCKSHNSIKLARNINDLPIEWQAKIIYNAFKFKDHWQQLQETCQ